MQSSASLAAFGPIRGDEEEAAHDAGHIRAAFDEWQLAKPSTAYDSTSQLCHGPVMWLCEECRTAWLTGNKAVKMSTGNF